MLLFINNRSGGGWLNHLREILLLEMSNQVLWGGGFGGRIEGGIGNKSDPNIQQKLLLKIGEEK